MRRFILPVSVVLLATACGSSSTPVAAPAESPASATRAEPSPAKDCGPLRDVDVWMKAPGLPTTGQVLGSYSPADCRSTFEMLEGTSPTEAGYCTKAAYASDNPGYNADASPAAPLKKVQLSVGPAC